jgi:hypothetical protein
MFSEPTPSHPFQTMMGASLANYDPNVQEAVYLAKFSDPLGGQDSLVDKALDYRPKGTGFDPRLHHNRRST